jgi:hypothetical protein
MHTRADLDRARGHVEDGERRVIAQERLITKLIAERHPTAEAYELLQMEVALSDMRQHLRDIEADLARAT